MGVLTILFYLLCFAQPLPHHPIHRIQGHHRPIGTKPQPPIPSIQPIPSQLPVIGIPELKRPERQQSFTDLGPGFNQFGFANTPLGGRGYQPRGIKRHTQPSGGSNYPKLYKYASLREMDLATPRDKLRRLMRQLTPQEPKPVHLTQGMLDKYLDEHPLPDVRASFRNIQRGLY